MGELVDADGVSEVLAHCKADADLLAALGGGPEHISGLNEGPYPHLVVSPGFGGDLRDLLAVHVAEVLVEVYGPLDGSVGSHDLWRILMRALVSIKGMPERAHVPGRAIVSGVTVIGGITRQPLESGQMRWQAITNVAVSPPN